jgi:hypothetical protein
MRRKYWKRGSVEAKEEPVSSFIERFMRLRGTVSSSLVELLVKPLADQMFK